MQFMNALRPAGTFWALLLLLPMTAAHAQSNVLNQAMKVQNDSDTKAQRAQAQVTRLAQETQELLGDYRVTVQQLDRVRIYNNHMQRLVDDQNEEKQSILRQLDNIETVNTGIIPLMYDMIDTLEQFVELDMPFNLKERTDRVANLRENMDKSDITISEKFRQIMSAYQTETAFGRDTEATVTTLNLGNPPQPREVNILRVGRILLAYQTADRNDTGFFNPKTRQWEPLSDEYRKPVTEGLRVAKKQAAPNLLKLPIAAPERAK